MINMIKIKEELKSNKKGSITSALIIMIYCFLVLFPVLLLLSGIWAQARPIFDNQTITGNNATVANQINRIGDSFFFYSSDSIIVLMYFALIIALFISAIYEQARPETLPIGLLFLIPLILITFPLADLAHYFYTNPGFANVAGYYGSTEYLADNSPLITILITIVYLVFVVTKRQIFGGNSGSGGGGVNIVSG